MDNNLEAAMTESDYFSDFPQPPVDMVCPATPQLVITVILTVVCVAVLAFSLFQWRTTGRPIMLMTALGGALASFNEPIMDILARVWFADGGQQWTIFQTFGRPIPVWLPMAYFAFFGALPYLLSRFLQAGADTRRFWLAVAIPIGLNVLLEVPLLQAGLYVYYGEQPFQLLGLPLYWAVINTLGVMLDCTIIILFGRHLTGARVLVLAVVPVFTQLAAGAVGVPIFSLGNTNASAIALWIAACVPFVLGFTAFHILGKLIRGTVEATSPVGEGGPQSDGRSAKDLSNAAVR